MSNNKDPEKDQIRNKIWSLLEDQDVARFPRPVKGRIPNFVGADRAADRLFQTDQFGGAEVIKCNPDSPQLPVRRRALELGKVLMMPSPRLKSGFLVLNPGSIPARLYEKAAAIRGSFKYGEKLGIKDLPNVDAIVCGSVAVTREGRRLGKGGGYSEIEYGILREMELVEEGVPILTTVHELQVISSIPTEEHDFTVDIVATPTELIESTGPVSRPRGIIWELISQDQLDEMPILAELKKRREWKRNG